LAALGTAAATLQHRLGNTINVILPAVLRLRFRVGHDPDNLEILDTIERNALFATDVIRRMQTPLRKEPPVWTNVNLLLWDAIQMCIQDTDRFPDIQITTNLPGLTRDVSGLPIRSQQQITITANLDESTPETYVSSGQLTEVFRVLVENAVKAIYPKSGSVMVVSKFADDRIHPCVEIKVKDTGKGIDEKTQSRLFTEPVPRKEFGQGAGLGLWLSKYIVRSHQGSIELQSTELNKGSSFLVRLPISRQALAGYTPQPGESL
jgi:signal transduction histidine kinase